MLRCARSEAARLQDHGTGHGFGIVAVREDGALGRAVHLRRLAPEMDRTTWHYHGPTVGLMGSELVERNGGFDRLEMV